MNLTDATYHSLDADREFLSNSQIGDFQDCESRAVAKLAGKYVEPSDKTLLIGKYWHTLLLEPHRIPEFTKTHADQMFKKDGSPLAEFKHAVVMAETCKADPYFMAALSGEHEVIITWEMFGAKWKAKLDAVDSDFAVIADAKGMKSINGLEWSEERHAKVPFYEIWNYWRQFSIYREAFRSKYGHPPVMCFMAACSKEDPPDHDVIEFSDQVRFQHELNKVETMVPRILALKAGEEEPVACGRCDWCRSQKRVLLPVVAISFA